MGRKVYVVGVGMTKFEKPGRREDFDYPQMATEAVTKALNDSGLPYSAVQQAVVGYVYGDSTCGQRAIYEVGLTGIPIYNVNNNCSTGSSALMLAKQLVEGGIAECALALGFEKMERGSLSSKYTDRTNPMDKHVGVMAETRGLEASPMTAQMFGNAGREHMEKYGTTKEHFAKIAYKNHKHSANNPYAQFRDQYTLQQVMDAPSIHEPLTKLQCSPTSDGSAAAVVASEDFVRKHGLEGQAVEIAALCMATDLPSSFSENSCIKMVGFDMSAKAANQAYATAGVTAKDVAVVELHDCFSCNELLTYEALGLCPIGQAGQFIDSGNNTYGGKYVVNPSGGLISKGHPLGATGIAQCAELCWQLRRMAGARQVPNVKVALQHNIGLGGAAIVGLYRLGFPNHLKSPPKDAENPAINDKAGLLRAAPAASASSAAASPAKPAAAAAATEGAVTSAFVFKEIAARLATDGAALVKQVGGIYRFTLSAPDSTWTLDLKSGNGAVSKSSLGNADCTIAMTDSDFVKLMLGQVDSQKLFMNGKLKVKGNMGLAMKLKVLQPAKPKL
ncbi:sterol carrier protein 2 [Capsaspora owczarzaki ATCC 30864]|nr:sterol carrier protein 2 [Capsaspora owczarzaki ATCC 30864]|eukprot:XP_004364627.1 sterol carrier protein 2 [Capsaspora owczarzaki ATCC 30864]